MNDWSQLYLQHSTSHCRKRNLGCTGIVSNEIWARKIDIVIPFKSSHSSKPKRRRQRYVLFTGLVKIFHGAVAILNQPHPVLTEFQRYYFGTQCNLVFCDLVFEQGGDTLSGPALFSVLHLMLFLAVSDQLFWRHCHSLTDHAENLDHIHIT